MEKKKGMSVVFIIIIIIQFMAIGWLVYEKFNTKAETIVLIQKLETSKTEKDSLVTELEELYGSYQDLETNNSELNNKLSQEQEKIEELLIQLKNVKASDRYAITRYKKEIETLKNIMKSYIAQINDLNTKNQKLIAENEEIKSSYENVVDEKDDLIEKSDSLQNKVEIAAELQALNLDFIALNKREKSTNRIKKTKKFQICFTVNQNKISQKGNKTVYGRITNPSGTVLINNISAFGNVSGEFEFEGNNINYSSKANIVYDGTKQFVCLYYNNQESLPKGTYTVFIFIDGKQIESTKLTLK